MGGTDWTAGVRRSLEAIAWGLPVDLESSPTALHDETVVMLLVLATAALPSRNQPAPRLATHWKGHCDDNGTAPVEHAAWQALIAIAKQCDCPWLEAPQTLRALPRLSRCRPEHGTSAKLVAWVEALASAASASPEALAAQLGLLHERLMVFRFEQLTCPGLPLRGGRGWLSPTRVLAWPREARAQRLRDELGLSKSRLVKLGEALGRANHTCEVEAALHALVSPGMQKAPAGQWVVQNATTRRRSGAHYTPAPLCSALVERTLSPLLERLASPRSVSLLSLRICDPAMGAGAFLIAAGGLLAQQLAAAWQQEGEKVGASADETRRQARREVVRHVLRGVDKNPVAVSLARLSLQRFADSNAAVSLDLTETLRCGDALLGRSRSADAPFVSNAAAGERQERLAVDFPAAFVDVFGREDPGFDAVIGNPPWVAFVGRAAQPLDPALAAYFLATNPAFRRYRTLHGLFIYRCATLLRSGGRLGLVLPTSVADLHGYRETRQAHDALCNVDPELPDWGDGAFEGVFQPSMALLSTRRAPVDPPAEPRAVPARAWTLSRSDLNATEQALLTRLAALPRLPPELFGERGFQTTRDDQKHLRRQTERGGAYQTPLREGADVSEFGLRAPSLFADSEALGRRLRAPQQWQAVSLLIRQTARYPIAAPSDGSAFRNSIIACFESPEWPKDVLLAYLNSSLARFFHYATHRDARQGMPQLKVGHLRTLPAIPSTARRHHQPLRQLAARIVADASGVSSEQRQRLDAAIGDAFELTAEERRAVQTFANAHPLPTSRSRQRELETDGSRTGPPAG